MSDKKELAAKLDSGDPKALAEVAEQMEAEAKKRPGIGTYTHKFKTPFTYEGRTFKILTFDFESLTGADSLAVENEMRMKGQTLVLDAYTGDYLVSIAARACAERDETGGRVVSAATIAAMPLGAYRAITGKVRTFLLRSGS